MIKILCDMPETDYVTSNVKATLFFKLWCSNYLELTMHILQNRISEINNALLWQG